MLIHGSMPSAALFRNHNMKSETKSRIVTISIKDADLIQSSIIVQKDRETALENLKNDSFFQPANDLNGPYGLELSTEENKLIFHITSDQGKALPLLVLSINPYRRIIKDYFMIVQSYDEALRDGKPSRIEAIDMGRRGLHNEGASLLMDRLEDKIKMDLATARRLFTLICVLHSGKVHTKR
jgi:uncharacterized protein (UPF0262 family)